METARPATPRRKYPRAVNATTIIAFFIPIYPIKDLLSITKAMQIEDQILVTLCNKYGA
jgi:hypothetical protein